MKADNRKKIHSLKRISDWSQNGALWESSYIVMWLKRGTLYSSEIVVYRTNQGFSYEGDVDLTKSEFEDLLEKFEFYFERSIQFRNEDLLS